MVNKTAAALTLSFLTLAACEVTGDDITWDEEGIWECHNEFNGKSISFDTEAEDTAILVGLINLSLTGTDIETGRKFTMLNNDGWVCTLPSGTELPMETSPEPQP